MASDDLNSGTEERGPDGFGHRSSPSGLGEPIRATASESSIEPSASYDRSSNNIDTSTIPTAADPTLHLQVRERRGNSIRTNDTPEHRKAKKMRKDA